MSGMSPVPFKLTDALIGSVLSNATVQSRMTPTSIANAMAQIGANAVGQVAFASTSLADFTIGANVSGGNLRWCGTHCNGNGLDTDISFGATGLAGTWMCLGRAPGVPGSIEGQTIFRRIA